MKATSYKNYYSSNNHQAQPQPSDNQLYTLVNCWLKWFLLPRGSKVSSDLAYLLRGQCPVCQGSENCAQFKPTEPDRCFGKLKGRSGFQPLGRSTLSQQKLEGEGGAK